MSSGDSPALGVDGADGAMSKPPMITLEAARQQLQEVAGDLATIRSRLLDLAAALPESPTESDLPPGAEDEVDAPTELRAVIRCVLEDSIRPAIDDLWGAAAMVRSRPADGVIDERAS